RMRDVGVQLETTVAIAVVLAEVAIVIESRAAAVAEACAQMVLLAAALAMIAELARRHGEEQAVGAFDQLDVADDEGVVEGQGTERLEARTARGAQVDADFRKLHGTSCIKTRCENTRPLRRTLRCEGGGFAPRTQ